MQNLLAVNQSSSYISCLTHTRTYRCQWGTVAHVHAEFVSSKQEKMYILINFKVHNCRLHSQPCTCKHVIQALPWSTFYLYHNGIHTQLFRKCLAWITYHKLMVLSHNEWVAYKPQEPTTLGNPQQSNHSCLLISTFELLAGGLRGRLTRTPHCLCWLSRSSFLPPLPLPSLPTTTHPLKMKALAQSL